MPRPLVGGGEVQIVEETYLPGCPVSAAARLAKEDGVSLNQWIAGAVARKVDAVETAAEFFKRRANGRTGEGLGRVLDMVPDRPPEPGDELPKGWVPGLTIEDKSRAAKCSR